MGEEDEDRGACLVQSPRGEGGCCPSLNTCQIPPSPRPFHAIILSPILPRVSDRRHREKARHRLRDAGHDPAAGTTWATVGSRGPNSTRTPPPRGKLALARNAQRRTVSGRPSPPPLSRCRDPGPHTSPPTPNGTRAWPWAAPASPGPRNKTPKRPSGRENRAWYPGTLHEEALLRRAATSPTTTSALAEAWRWAIAPAKTRRMIPKVARVALPTLACVCGSAAREGTNGAPAG